jgi:hypothetical protein
VDVDDPAGKAVQKRRSENQHPAGEDEQIGLECQKYVGKLKIVGVTCNGVVAIGERQ